MTDHPGGSVRSRIDLRYALGTGLYLVAIYWLSSIPDPALRESHPVIRVLSNLAHAPIFAGLAFCIHRSLAGWSGSARDRYLTAFAITAVLAVIDEWHQSFVPGRNASVGDLLLDLVGITSVLLVVAIRALSVRTRCEAE